MALALATVLKNMIEVAQSADNLRFRDPRCFQEAEIGIEYCGT